MLAKTITGAGLGLRLPHAQALLADKSIEINWLELLADNWLAAGGLNLRILDELSERFPLVLHGVGLSLGGPKPLDLAYLTKIKNLKQRCGAIWYSEHASFSHFSDLSVPDLLPLPYTEESITHLSSRIRQAQDFLEETILLENVSAYVSAPFNEMDEGSFLAAVAQESGCNLLLDVNNAYVNSINLQLALPDFFNALPTERIKQIHLGGYESRDGYLLDAHNHPVSPQVWQLFQQCLERYGPVPSMIEWDNDLPSLERLLQEYAMADSALQTSQSRRIQARPATRPIKACKTGVRG